MTRRERVLGTVLNGTLGLLVAAYAVRVGPGAFVANLWAWLTSYLWAAVQTPRGAALIVGFGLIAYAHHSYSERIAFVSVALGYSIILASFFKVGAGASVWDAGSLIAGSALGVATILQERRRPTNA
jgi:hypothetical protein